MDLKLKPHKTFAGRRKPVLIIVMDGVGIAPDQPGNAVSRANAPVLHELFQRELGTILFTHGKHVGLPSCGDMGNSEVGHNALGAGRVIAQGASLINRAISSGKLFEGEHWQNTIKRGLEGGTIHFLGLLSEGNVHASIQHLFSLLEATSNAGVHRVRLHLLLDGRDVAPQSALQYLDILQEVLDQFNASGKDYRIASGGGRQVITMDRYGANPAMVKKGYDCHVHGIGAKVSSAQAAVEAYYHDQPEGTDQDIPEFVIADKNGEPAGIMKDGDAVVLYNYRGDRALEIASALDLEDFDLFDRGELPDLYFCGIIEYDGDAHIPSKYLVSPPVIKNTMVEYMCDMGLKTFAISETQKFGHVTYFWNGNRSGYLCEELESYVEIKSDVIPFNQKPKMKAREITDATIALLKEPDMRFGRINFANGDMVGHTGDFEATKIAVETVDQCVGELLDVAKEIGAVVLVTADHGNAEEIFTLVGDTKKMKTSHTLNPVPFVIVDPEFKGEYQINNEIRVPCLVNIAATVFNLLGYEAPSDYESSLIEFL